MKLSFREITEENYRDVLKIRQTKEQEEKKYVANVVYSLADAWLYRNDGMTHPYAIYRQETLVGFILIEEDTEDNQYFIWRMIIDEKYQHQGIGSAVVDLAIEKTRAHPQLEKVVADYVEGHDIMKKILIKKGFVQTNEYTYENHKEYEMTYYL